MLRLLRWFRRRTPPPPAAVCFACRKVVGPCPACGGEYRARACAECTVGIVCTAGHGKFWF